MVFGKYTAPVFTDIVNKTVVIRKLANDTLCREAGINKGDIILAVDDEPVVLKVNQLNQYISASNNMRRDYDLSIKLLNTTNEYQRLKIKRGNRIFTVKVKCILTSARYWVDLFNYKNDEQGYKPIGNSIAYIYASSIWGANVDKMKALIKSKKAVIFDVRNYPNSDTFYNIFDIFLPKPTAIDVELQMLANNPGYFKWMKVAKIGNINPDIYQGKAIILVDERTQSQGEYSAMALQTIPNSVTIGSQTAGGDGVVTPVPMGGKLNLSYSGYGVYYPNKAQTQRVGVKIDIPVKKTVESVIKGDDLILEKALKYLKEKGID
ncbi:MAG: S41 family peptidase [Mucilaginibacter sp.]|uniref:S41 family peptidase n=1 Tax=Mucilaginibacter sp. TaxID=1882438 RepID=UPI0034E56C34